MTLDELVGHRVRSYRKARGWSQLDLCAQLHDRCGLSMSKPTLIRLETGKRGASVTEVAGLALTLEVPPAALVTPSQTDDQTVQLTPNGTLSTTSRAYFWWIGLDGPTDPDGFALNGASTLAGPFHGELRRYAAALRLHVTQGSLLDEVTHLDSLEELAELAADPESRVSSPPTDADVKRATERVGHAGRLFIRSLRNAREAGLPPYPVSRELWPRLAASVGRDDPEGWAHDEGIRPYEPGGEA